MTDDSKKKIEEELARQLGPKSPAEKGGQEKVATKDKDGELPKTGSFDGSHAK